MKKILKKYAALLLALTMCLNMFPLIPEASGLAKASEKETQNEEFSRTGSVEMIYINPLYEDVIDESDLNQSSDSYAVDTADVSEYCSSVEEAGVQMRGSMTEREESVEIGLQTARLTQDMSQDEVNEVYAALATEIFTEAVEHTGNPVEGDYLKWQYAGWKCSGSYSFRSGTAYVTFKYTITYYTTAAQEEKMDAEVDKLLAQLDLSGKSEYCRISGIYDYICENVTYDYDNLEDDDYKLKYTAYAALINKTAICQGYALLFYRLALELNVDSRLIAGTSNGENHAWNIAKINKKYYNLDSTWDAGKEEYIYFLKCNENFEDHKRMDEYSSEEFNEAYPMDTKDYTPRTDNPFEDVSIEDYYYEPVLWAYEKGITSGVDSNHFNPGDPCTRGQVVTFLWRAKGKPEHTSEDCPFEDVNPEDYYYDAVMWAYENGVTSGMDSSHFKPNDTVTRGQFVTFLWRAEGEPSCTLTASPFKDLQSDSYYYNAVLWAYENEITSGVDEDHFAPENECSRGEVVTFLYRAYE